jgi:calcineurin-like phosphoesterase
MSILSVVSDILSILNTRVDPTLDNTNTVINALNIEAQATMKQAQQLMTRIDPILTSISRIEDFIFALLIFAAVSMLSMFLFWFFRHVYPLIRKQHTHVHTADNVVRDLTDVPVRMSFEQSMKRDF